MELEKTPLTSMAENPLLSKADIESRQPTKDGKTAYAYRQASIRDRMLAHFTLEWKDFPAKLLQMEGRDARIRIECH